VKKIVAGPGIYICDDCIFVCLDILKREGYSSRLLQVGTDLFDLEYLVAMTEVASKTSMTETCDNPDPANELLLQFREGVTVRLPLSERGRIEEAVRKYKI
jgi:hypothetical protein